MNRRMDEWMDGRTNGWMDGWILYERFGQTRCDLLTTFVSAVARKSLSSPALSNHVKQLSNVTC